MDDGKMENLSLEVFDQMELAGFNAKRTRFHQNLAAVLEELLNVRGNIVDQIWNMYLDERSDEEVVRDYLITIGVHAAYTEEARDDISSWNADMVRLVWKQNRQYFLCGSYAECSTYNLQCADGSVSVLSDVDITWSDRFDRKVCFQGCESCEMENHCRTEDTAEGHVKLVGTNPDTMSPALTYPPQSCKPAVDLALGYECTSWHKNCKFLHSDNHKKCIDFVKACENEIVHVVRAARPGHIGKEYRISHSMLEKACFWCMLNMFHKVFTIYKYIIKKTPLKECGVRTYLGKTLTFYLCDKYMTGDKKLHQNQLLDLVIEGLEMLLEFLQDSEQPSNSVMNHYFHDNALIYLKANHLSRPVLIEQVNYVLQNFDEIIHQFVDQLTPIRHHFHFVQPFGYLQLSFPHLSFPTKRSEKLLGYLSNISSARNNFALLPDKVYFYMHHLALSTHNHTFDVDVSMELINQLFKTSNSPEHGIANVLRVLTLLNTDNKVDVGSILSTVHYDYLLLNSDVNDIQGYVWNELTDKNIVWWFPVHVDCLSLFPKPIRLFKYKHPLELVVINFMAVTNVLRCQHQVDEWTTDKWFHQLNQQPFIDWQELYSFATVTTDLYQLVWAAERLSQLAVVELDIQLTEELVNTICERLIEERMTVEVGPQIQFKFQTFLYSKFDKQEKIMRQLKMRNRILSACFVIGGILLGFYGYKKYSLV